MAPRSRSAGWKAQARCEAGTATSGSCNGRSAAVGSSEAAPWSTETWLQRC